MKPKAPWRCTCQFNNIPPGPQAGGHGATIPSSYGPKDTMNRLEAAVKAKGMTIFARIDHAAGASAVGLSLRPTEER
jgi:hypothetical protein